MYFIQQQLFQELCDHGLSLAERDYGVHRIANTPGVIVNPDALTLEVLTSSLARARGDGHHVTLETDQIGFWHVRPVAPEPTPDAGPDAGRATGDADEAAAATPAAATPAAATPTAASLPPGTHLLAADLVYRVIGSTQANAADRLELPDDPDSPALFIVRPGTRAHELMAGWMARQPHHLARPDWLRLPEGVVLLQQRFGPPHRTADTDRAGDAPHPTGTRDQDRPDPHASAPNAATNAAPVLEPVFEPASMADAAARIAEAALTAYRTRLTLPARVLRRADDPAVCGLPARDPEQLTVVLGAVPGHGRVRDLGAPLPMAITDVLHEGTQEIQVPPARVPEGMHALEVNGRTVGCYDDRMLVLFAPNSVLLALVLPAWLENFVHDAAPQRDRAADAHRLARVALTSRNTGSGRFLSLRQEVAAKRRRCEEARISREALEAYLQQHRPSFDPETIMDAVEALADDPTWELEVRYGVVRFKLRDHRVRDPRDGTWRRLPSTLTVHLGDWLAGVGPFKDHPQDAPVSGRHPRVCGRGFLHAEIDEAVHDCLRASDLAGGLALIHDVLTSFEADDPDVAALDHWRRAREAA